MRLAFTAASLFLCGAAVHGAEDPVQWRLAWESQAAPGGRAAGKLTATIQPGWHLYSLSTPRPPIATTISLAASPAVEDINVYQPAPIRKRDPNFDVDTETFEKEVVFLIEAHVKPGAEPGPADVTIQVRYQSCNDTLCLPPRKKTASAPLVIQAGAAAEIKIPPGYSKVEKPAPRASVPESTPASPAAPRGSQDLARFLLIAFGFGLAAIFTPCVFPMIPFTVSYFLGQESNSRRQGVMQALLFCAGIVTLFTALGLAAKAIAGPFGVVQLGASPWVNAFIALVFVVFGLSLLGAFELTLPSGFLTKADAVSRRGGYVGTLVMGLTFSLTAFACVGPIVGPLLVASVQSEGLQPVLGMMSFSSGLAAPFFLLALFPSYLKRMPRSGGWLSRIKVVLGFVVLAGALKYLGNVDQVLQWNVLTRERFLSVWVVLFALAGLYLLGFLRLEGIRPDEQIGVGRTLAGAFFLMFALSLVPGMFGSGLGEIDAYVPLSANASTSGAAAAPGRAAWLKNQYEEALARARQENKLLFVNFTGYACTNCHWMKANMFPRPEIQQAFGNLVLLELYTDGSDEASRRNQELQEKRFGTVAIPFYAILDANEKIIATFPGISRNPQQFLAFLKTGTKS